MIEGACYYKNNKAIGFLTLVAGCNLDMVHVLGGGKGYNCNSLIFAKRKKQTKKLCGDDKKDEKKVADNAQKSKERKLFETATK